jgi:hypothetical protein
LGGGDFGFTQRRNLAVTHGWCSFFASTTVSDALIW